LDAETGPDDTTESQDATVLVLPSRQKAGSRVLFGFGRSLVTLAAVGVLAVTGYNWTALHNLDQGIARTDVFGNTKLAPTTGNNAPVVPPLTSDVNILLVGLDSRTDPHGNPLPASELNMLNAGPDTGELNTDTMILVHIPAGGQRATAISFPRDAYVQIAGGFGKDRLNAAFAYGHNAEASRLRAQGVTDSAQIEQQADTAGRQNLIATIEQLIGNAVTINRYAEINLAGFYQMSLAVGGVQVCLKAATHDDYTGASFPAGVQTISGVQALNFVRQRHGLPAGDLDRITRQQVFLGGLAAKMLSAGTLTSPSKMSALITAVQNSVTLSSGWDITSFALQMQGLTSGAIQFATIPTGPNVLIGGADVTQMDPAAVARFVNGMVNPAPPTPTTPNYDGGSPVVTTTTAPAAPPAPTTTGPITANGIPCVN
jgi:LCP family protein required for cell wall assembly